MLSVLCTEIPGLAFKDGFPRLQAVTDLIRSQETKVRFGVLQSLCWRVAIGTILRVAVLGVGIRLNRVRARIRLSAVGGGAVQEGYWDRGGLTSKYDLYNNTLFGLKRFTLYESKILAK